MDRAAESHPAILVEGLHKSFGDVHALAGIDFDVPRGTVLGVLGPNGAGKTTAVKILTTLLRPDAGTALVDGRDVRKDPAGVRRSIGLAGQSAAIVSELSGRENLDFIGRLHHLNRAAVRARTTELLEKFDLVAAADRRAKTYSGGMQRRLDLAASLVSEPPVLFLDEPTTGLDPRARNDMWEVIRDLVANGTTLMLTTQYLDEADELADDIVVIDHGRIIARGTPEALKDRVGGDIVEFVIADPALRSAANTAVAGLVKEPAVDPDGKFALRVGQRASEVLIEVVRRLDGAGVAPAGLGIRRPSLDDVFLALTGHASTEAGAPDTSEPAA